MSSECEIWPESYWSSFVVGLVEIWEILWLTNICLIISYSVINSNHTRFEVVTVPLLKIQVFWEVILHHWANGSSHFGGFWCLYLWGQAVKTATKSVSSIQFDGCNKQLLDLGMWNLKPKLSLITFTNTLWNVVCNLSIINIVMVQNFQLCSSIILCWQNPCLCSNFPQAKKVSKVSIASTVITPSVTITTRVYQYVHLQAISKNILT